MTNIIIQVSKYLIIILMAAYTFSCFSIFTRSYEDEENKVLIRQDVLLFMIQITAFIAMYFATQERITSAKWKVMRRRKQSFAL